MLPRRASRCRRSCCATAARKPNGKTMAEAVLNTIPFNMGNRQKHGLFEKNRGRELRKTEPDCKKPRKIGHSCMLRGLVLNTSALLTFLRNEPGADKVAAVLTRACIAAVNLAEAIGKMAEHGKPLDQVAY